MRSAAQHARVRIDGHQRARRQRQHALAVRHGQLLDAVIDAYFERHREGAAVLELPAQRELVAGARLDQFGQRGVVQIGVEEPAQVAAGRFVGDADEFLRAAPARLELARYRRVGTVHHAPRGAEKGVVAQQVAQRVQDQRTLDVDVVARTAFIGIVHILDALGFAADDGGLVLDGLALLEQLGLERHLAAQRLQVQRLHIAAEAFVQPHVVPVGVGHLVAEPFVRQLVVQQPVVTVRRLQVLVAVGVDGLVFHAQVRGFDHAHFFVAERVRADAAFEEIEHGREFVEQSLRLLAVFLVPFQVPVAQRDGIAVAANVVARQHVVWPDVERHAVGAGIPGAPVVGAPAVFFRHAGGYAVAGDDQGRRHRDVQVDQFRFAHRVIDAGPEQIAPFAFHRGGNPRLAVGGPGPHEGAVPRRPFCHVRHAVVADAHGGALARQQRFGQGEVQAAVGIADGRCRQGDAVHAGAVDRQVAVEFHRDAGERRSGGEGERSVAADALRRRIDAQRHIGMLERDRQLLGRAWAAGVGGEVGHRCRGGGAAGQHGAGGKQKGQACHADSGKLKAMLNIAARVANK